MKNLLLWIALALLIAVIIFLALVAPAAQELSNGLVPVTGGWGW